MRAGTLLRRLRIALSGAVLAIFVGGIVFGEWASSSADALAFGQLVPALLRWRQLLLGGTVGLLFVFPLIISVTLLIGRGYCSSLCPLGTLQDLVISGARRTRLLRLRFQKPHTWLRLATLAVTLALWLAGSTLLFGLLEPYTITHRGLASLATLIEGRPTGQPPIATLPLAESEDPAELSAAQALPRPVDDIAALLAGLVVLIAVLAAAAGKGRLFCNTLCPAGALLAASAHRSLLRIRLDPDACTACGRCSRICPARCIDSTTKRVYAGSCVLCFDCLSACPTDAIHYSSRRGRP